MKTILLKILLLFGFIFSTTFLFGQDKCELSKLSKTDKQILDNFWNDFKGAINSRDTQKLASLCSFPFPCSYCKKKITQTSFYESGYKIFFEDNFIAEINKYDSAKDYFIYHGDFHQKHKGCSYIFSYSKGKEIFFDVTKIDNSYKITSTWRKL